MDRTAFLAMLRTEGFPEPVEVIKDGPGAMPEHRHPFEAKALIVSGEMRIRTATGERHYAVNDIFHLAAQEPHSEEYGLHGVTYLVGRKMHGTA